MTPRKQYLNAQAKIFKALGHPSRLLMVEALGQGPLCVGDLRQRVGSDLSTVSKHLSVLKEAGIVDDERQGTTVRYSLRLSCVTGFLSCVDHFFTRQIDEQISYLKDLRNNSNG